MSKMLSSSSALINEERNNTSMSGSDEQVLLNKNKLTEYLSKEWDEETNEETKEVLYELLSLINEGVFDN